MNDASARAARIRLMIFDVDGILTDGSLHFSADGEALKTFNVLDGQGIRLLQDAGIATAIISARQSPIVSKRAADLGITHVRQGIHDKKTAFLSLLTELQIAAEECGFIGDDIIDLPVLTRVGFAASVPNGHLEVRQRVHYVCNTGGGHGAAREVCDFILRAQNKYEQVLSSYLT
ncbi:MULTISPECIES: HAD family hydrolase [unclassified Undibacterium]|uniref:KdsC family phosphatase n=1 Tax=unclassified Undibacterium TaxID=2630295 RepID=UPI002AC95401|nr:MULTISPECIES: HAD family hydrolase [unclassified Undibacterium]MEB0140963.1 HAD family hydrolase [Undibacterium sp. CCC2.1]MEB0173971.1 HAD family hydrolase [Undibacterium sp. CCC1.1]MEB0177905.1 HAD family hydrolase [Undibacterium sp. CCC3.4]MEB0217149.1 HAD family hydrolase [Undibacterium sp. 5I2]WPX44388.1 HAD family hydrolase [Undibacterium sp. CCC3.4]